MKDILSKINVGMICVVALVAKLIILDGNLADALAIIGLAGFLAVKLYLDIKKDNLLDKANEQIAKIAAEYQKLSTEISTLKMRMGMEQTTRKISNVEKQKADAKQKRYF